MNKFERYLSQLEKTNKKLQQEMLEHNLLEEKLRSSENKIRAVFEAMTDIVLIINMDNQMLSNVEIIPTKYINLYDSDVDLIGETVEQFFQEKSGVIWLEKINEALRLMQTIHYDYSLIAKNTKYWFSASISPISEIEVVWVARDISDRKFTEEALQKSELRERKKSQELEKTLLELKLTQSRLLLSEKMASLGNLVAGIAHEINNPISFIYGNIDAAKNYTQDLLSLIDLYQTQYSEPGIQIIKKISDIDLDFLAKDFPRLLNSMDEGADRISKIVQSLKEFSHLDEASYKLIDIHTDIDNTITLLQHRIYQFPHSKKIKIIKEYTKLPKVECYPRKLNEVFMNIISNAIDALEERIKINDTPHPWIRIVTETIENQAVIRIADNGIGMTPYVSKHLFDPFFTTKTVGKGTGMGLAVSYQIIVDNHQGELQSISELGKGTEFIISIPLRLTKLDD